jgi:hypothetical protein
LIACFQIRPRRDFKRNIPVEEVMHMMNNQVTSYCHKGAMSICAANNEKQQTDCGFYEKSRNANRCMYYIFEEYCDNLMAQISAEEVGNRPMP